MIDNPKNSYSKEQLKLVISEIFGELIMPLFNTLETSNASVKETIQASTYTMPIHTDASSIVDAKLNRRGLIIYNPSVTSTVKIGFFLNDNETDLQSTVIVISPGKAFELPTSGDGSCYGGIIYAKADIADTNFLQITEFFA